MTRNEAQFELLAYRPGAEPDLSQAAALERIETDVELSEWYVNHCKTQVALRERFRSIPVPAELKEKILNENRKLTTDCTDGADAGITQRRREGRGSEESPKSEIRNPKELRNPKSEGGEKREETADYADEKIIRTVWWRQPAVWLAAAACMALLCVAGNMVMQSRAGGTFMQCRERLVRAAIREYRMDVASSDAEAVRGYMRKHGAPSDYVVTEGLQKLALAGGGLMRWQGEPVSMVCFQRADKQMVYLFVVDRTKVKGAPEQVQLAKISKLATGTWSTGNRSYILAAQEVREEEIGK